MNWKTIAVLLLVLGLAQTASATVTTDPYHAISIDEMSWQQALTMKPDGSAVYGFYEGVLSQVSGTSWASVYDTGMDGSGRDIFCDTAGNVYVPLSDSGAIFKLVPGTPWTHSKVLTFNCTADDVTFWNMCAAAGSLYCIEYGECGDADPRAYRSSTGDHWTAVFTFDSPNYRHGHGMWPNAAGDTLFVSLGDGTGTMAIKFSVDSGVSWTNISTTRQPISMQLAADGSRLFGSDLGDGSNTIFRQEGTSTINTEVELTGEDDCFVWSMAGDGHVCFAGTVSRDDPNDTCHILRRDLNGDWYSVYEITDVPIWYGFKDMAGPDANGYYYTNRQAPTGSQVLRFRDHDIWTVGTGGDYADIETALAGTPVAAGDTLLLISDGYTEYDLNPADSNLTIKGATSTPANHTIWHDPSQVSLGTFRVFQAITKLTLENLEFQSASNMTGWDKGVVRIDSTRLILRNVAFVDIDNTNSQACIFAHGNVGQDTVECYNVTIDSCSAAGSAIMAHSVGKFVFEDGVVTNNASNNGIIRSYEADYGLVHGTLFASNTASSANFGACLAMRAAAPDSGIVRYCTFADYTPTDATAGAIRFAGGSANIILTHSIFSGDGSDYAWWDGDGATFLDRCEYVDAYNVGMSFKGMHAGSFVDTIKVDPEYTTTDLNTLQPYMAMSTDDDGSGSSPRETADGSYMGWLKPPGVPTGGDGLMGRLYRRRH